MITYLPFENFYESAACLDRQRLGKQRLDTLAIARCLAGVPSSWRNHPAVRMWRGYEFALVTYQEAVVHEWTVVRGYADGTAGELSCMVQTVEHLVDFKDTGSPPWLGEMKLHQSHASALLREDPAHYGTFFVDEVGDDLPIYWPC